MVDTHALIPDRSRLDRNVLRCFAGVNGQARGLQCGQFSPATDWTRILLDDLAAAFGKLRSAPRRSAEKRIDHCTSIVHGAARIGHLVAQGGGEADIDQALPLTRRAVPEFRRPIAGVL
jgi:hypothetical protein